MTLSDIGSIYGAYFSSLFFDKELAVGVFVLVAVLTIASLFIFKFYRSISKRNLISLNLDRYNTYEHSFANKLFAMFLYLVEYIIIMPFLILLWFAGLSIVLLLAAKNQPVEYILWASAGVVGAVRILAYIRLEISKDLAKLFPLVTLSFLLLSPGEFNVETISNKFAAIPSLLSQILSFVFIIFVIEIILRVLFTMYDFWRSEEKEAMEDILRQKQEEIDNS